jgi:hypothetical protein
VSECVVENIFITYFNWFNYRRKIQHPSARERGMRPAALDIYYNKMSTHICARLMMMMLCMYMALINPLGYDLHDKRKGVGIP